MAEHKSVVVAIIEAVAGLAWPIIALIALWTFRPALEQILDKAAAQLQGGASVELAGLKIDLPKSNLPRPPDRVVAILSQLDSEEVEYILTNVGDQSESECFMQSTTPDSFASDSAESRLQKSGLIVRQEVLKPYKSPDGTMCNSGSNIEFLPIYALTRNYLFDILKSLQFGSSETSR